MEAPHDRAERKEIRTLAGVAREGKRGASVSAMAMSLRLWQGNRCSTKQSSPRQEPLVWGSANRDDRQEKPDSSREPSAKSRIQGLERNDLPVLQPEVQCIRELWGTWDSGMPR